ncbi:MAG: hypothetical protein AMXMBFR16_11450 [Candidatus Uhrbacteria bacterium]
MVSRRYYRQQYERRYICNECYHRYHYWDVTPCPVNIATYNKIGSKRKYGVEIETSRCDNYQRLAGKTIFGAKRDGSIDGIEFVSPILYGDEGLNYVTELCDYGRDNDWTANNSCGLHIHIDVRNESDDELKNIAAAYAKTYDVWKKFVASRRVHCNWCNPHRWTLSDLDGYHDFLSFSYDQDRYYWFNVAAYSRHKTFEVRFMEGTVDDEKINNWIIAHTRFTDLAARTDRHTLTNMRSVTAQWEFVSQALGSLKSVYEPMLATAQPAYV